VLGGGAVVPPIHLVAARAARHLGEALGVSFIPHIIRPFADLSFREEIEMRNGITRMIEA
jgi:hypothetical protein